MVNDEAITPPMPPMPPLASSVPVSHLATVDAIVDTVVDEKAAIEVNEDGI